ncbi:hypothetical protein LR48_Vigan08g136000 [Vigna angularis]|uniref:Uncharacterized protein n=1 Tax=Phaseolus angularis TaxID=3914 RepID=A0A0L9V6C2_PHAAN|nr:hypothetical protein LR48_Vigan08g136000 [Vigna angularis]
MLLPLAQERSVYIFLCFSAVALFIFNYCMPLDFSFTPFGLTLRPFGDNDTLANFGGVVTSVPELGLNFDLTQFSENFECDCESGSCSICAEIDYTLQPDSKFITDAIKCEFDYKNAELKENAGADIKECMINEGEYTATSLSEPEISIPVSHTQQLPVEGEILSKQIAVKRKKKNLVVNDRAILMKEFLLKISSLDPEAKDISLIIQVWQLPP